MSTLPPAFFQIPIRTALCQHRYFRPGPHRDIWIGSHVQQKPHDVNPFAACCFPQKRPVVAAALGQQQRRVPLQMPFYSVQISASCILLTPVDTEAAAMA